MDPSGQQQDQEERQQQQQAVPEEAPTPLISNRGYPEPSTLLALPPLHLPEPSQGNNTSVSTKPSYWAPLNHNHPQDDDPGNNKRISPRFSSIHEQPIEMQLPASVSIHQKFSLITKNNDNNNTRQNQDRFLRDLNPPDGNPIPDVCPPTTMPQLVTPRNSELAEVHFLSSIPMYTTTAASSSSLFQQLLVIILGELLKSGQAYKLLVTSWNRLMLLSASSGMMFPLVEQQQQKTRTATPKSSHRNKNKLGTTSHTMMSSITLPSSIWTSASSTASSEAQPPSPIQEDDPCAILQISGISNYGQTCFLNSVLQSLASLKPLLWYLGCIASYDTQQMEPRASMLFTMSGGGDNNSISMSDIQQEQQAAVASTELLELLRAINGNEATATTTSARRRRSWISNNKVDARKFLTRIGAVHSRFRSTVSEQQDAHELLQAVMDVIMEEAKHDWNVFSVPNQQLVEEETFTTTDILNGMITPLHGSPTQQGAANKDDDSPAFARDWSPDNSTARKVTKELEARALNKTRSNSPTSTIRFSNLLHQIEMERQLHREKSQSSIIDQQYEKKQEEFEVSLPCTASEEDLQGFTYNQSTIDTHDTVSASQEQLQTTKRMDDSTISDDPSLGEENDLPMPPLSQSLRGVISPISPSPLSGWLGSTIRCCDCKHVRPIVNSPFLDLPITPTSVPLFLANAHRKPRPVSPSSRTQPYCTLEQCLADFTSVERVSDVECRNCTRLSQITELAEEEVLLKKAIESNLKRNQEADVSHMEGDLEKIQKRLTLLRNMDPDDEDSALLAPTDDGDLLDPSLVQTKTKLKRCDAKKCLLLTRRPSVLCCHVQRRYYDPATDMMEKCLQFVQFPLNLDLGPYCAYSSTSSAKWAAGRSGAEDTEVPAFIGGNMPYRLQSVIEHRGNVHGGHYVSYRRNDSGEWYRISDGNVTPIPLRQVLSCQAYMLFYEAV